jgi:hypothetical protein
MTEIKMKKQILIPILIAGAVLLIAGAGIGGFFGGRAYERNQANTIRNDFMRERGIENFDPNAIPGAGINMDANAMPGAGNFPGRGIGGATGEVKSIDGNTITLSTGQNETTVTLSDNTAIVKTTSGAVADLAEGQQVMVTGDRDEDGNVTATQVTILSAGANPSPANPAP